MPAVKPGPGAAAVARRSASARPSRRWDPRRGHGARGRPVWRCRSQLRVPVASSIPAPFPKQRLGRPRVGRAELAFLREQPVARHGFSGLGGVSVPLSVASYCLFSVSGCAGELTIGREAGGQQPGSAPTAFHPVQPLCAPSSRLVRGAQVLSTARPRQPLCSTV